MSALRVPQEAIRGRNKIVKFAGCYHGHCDAMLVKAGSGVMTQRRSRQRRCSGGLCPGHHDGCLQ